MVTVGTIAEKCWSPKNEPFKIDRKQTSGETTACLAGISKVNGVEHVRYFKRSVDIKKFI